MEFWEFLIQQDGDRSWLPIESPGAEILEGRYRVVARSSRINTPVEIRLTHIATEEDPPRRRIQKRTARTNPEGLIVVMPFSRLQPGVWELRCAGDLMEDMMGNGWRYAVQLQVLAQESDRDDRWEGDLEDENSPVEGYTNSMADAPEEAVAAVERSAESFIVPSEALPTVSVPVVPEAEPEVQPEPVFAETLVTGAASDTEGQVDLSCLRLAIADHYSLQRDQVLQIQGQVTALDTAPDFETPTLDLQITLRDPQTAQLLARTAQTLEAGILPRSFSLMLEPPELTGTRLLLGEASLLHEGTSVAFADFTVTAGLNDLLESIANSFVVDLHPPLEFTEQPLPSVDLSFLEFINTPKPLLNFHQSGKQILPPQIRHANRHRMKPKAIELPVFDRGGSKAELSNAGATPASTESHPTVSEEIPQEVREAAIAAVESLSQQAPELTEEIVSTPEMTPVEDPAVEQAIAPPPTHHTPIPSLSEIADSPLEWEQLAPALAAPNGAIAEAPLSPEDLAFRALNLQHRFWKRLYELASDRELFALLQADLAPSGDSTPVAVQEMVVEDNSPVPVDTGLYTIAQAEPLPVPLPSDDADTVPMPQLLIPPGELISGERITLTVKLPDGGRPIYVKLWVSDPQTHTILDGPRWITGFVPDGFGELVARNKLTIPHGCLEVKVEAVAIDVATQHESHKVSLPRSVVPPNLPTFSMDDLDL